MPLLSIVDVLFVFIVRFMIVLLSDHFIIYNEITERLYHLYWYVVN